jgi:hypothetical protein
MPLVERFLYQSQFSLAGGVVADIQAGALQAACDIAGNNESVFAHVAQDALARHSPQSAAALFEQGEQADEVIRRPGADKFAETAVFAGDIQNELRIGLHPHDFLAVADDARVLREAVYLLRAQHNNLLRGKTEKDIFEIIPLAVYHAPYKAGLEHAAGHLREPAAIFVAGQRPGAAHGGHQLVYCGGAAMALMGALQNGVETLQLFMATIAQRLIGRCLTAAEK